MVRNRVAGGNPVAAHARRGHIADAASSIAMASDARPQNHILRSLSAEARERIYPHLKLIPLSLGTVLYEPGHRMRHIYFPADTVVSLIHVLEDGACAEIAIVGSEGVVGVSLFMGGETTTTRAVVQNSGFAYQLSGARLKREFDRHGEMLRLLLRYTQSLITQMSQTAVCNRHHSVDQQLCRWLLLSTDRLCADELAMTHESIANMLGVRREGITDAAGGLQRRGVIRYKRGLIRILNRPALEKGCCECYQAVKKETDRLRMIDR
jgi:CRP-like cAMP-binding protein